MGLIDEEKFNNQKLTNNKIKKIIIILIILLVILCGVIIATIVYRTQHPTTIKTYIDGVLVQNFDQILDFQTDENGQTQIYIPIRDFATYLNAVNKDFGYQTFKGDYSPKTEEEEKCYTIREGYEVAIYTKGLRTIYKLNLQNKESEYQEIYIDKDIFESNEQLYISEEGLEKGYNIDFTYDDQKKIITIYTLDYLLQTHQNNLEKITIGNYGKMSVDEDYENSKSIFEGLLIARASNKKYGIIKTSEYSSFVLEPQYDEISYINNSKTFLVESEGKKGLFSKDGKRKINLIYDEIISMGKDSNLYVVETNDMYGVVDEDGNIIIYPEYSKIGIDVSSFSYNEVKNGYILLNQLIPVQKDGKWAFFDTEGNIITNGFVYESIGCTDIKSGNNIYPILQIEICDVIIVQDEQGKYSFIDTSGDDTILPFVFDSIYIQFITGEKLYKMIYRENEYDVLQYLNRVQ